MKYLLLVLALGLLAVWAADAQLVSNALGSHMVLQRAPQVARLWGWTKSAHERVRVSFNGQNYDVTSGSDRKWVHALPATPAGGPHSILVTSIEEKVLLEDVYFGDVWLCGGQSNMQFTVNTAFNATEEIALANRYPHVRLLTVGQGTTSTEPLPVLKTLEQPWSVANATSVGGKSWQHFSAVCWFFGKQLYDKYQVPIGLVSSNWGGTIVQAWSSPDALSKCKLSEPTVAAAATEATTSVVAEPTKLGGPNDNSVLWNAMIVPFLDLSLKGAIWYQGESNTGHADYYGCAFPAMINDWRSKFAKSGRELVFLFVQLAPWIGGANTAIPDIRQAQEKALELTDVGMATAIDLGDPTSPEGNIHPRNKQEVGRRLALVADHIAYGENNVVYLNPRATSAFVVDHAAGHVRIHFDKNTVPGGLVVHNNVCQVNAKFCTGYELQIDRGHWVAAKGAVVEDGTIVDVTTSVPQGSRLTGVRYAWSDWPVCTLYSKEGLPALQFSFLL